VEDVFCFVTFVVNSAVIVLQCVLSVLLDKPSGYRHVGVDDSDVRDYSNRTVKIRLSVEPFSRVIVQFSVVFDLVVV